MGAERKYRISIKNWAQDDRPREKLIRKGKASLSNAELMAILIGSGSQEESAVDLSKKILSGNRNSLNLLGKMSIKQLTKFKGIGPAKALSIAAAMELGRRRRMEEALETKRMTSSACVYELLQPIIGDLPHEEFWIVYLNNFNNVLDQLQLSKGGITGTLVDVRLALKTALEIGATCIILSHNHPSGNLTPSNADKILTEKLAAAGESVDIKVLDHVIVSDKSYFSFADEGLL
ncbi:MAG TPA: DNA repair protein RadC [Salinimicrobium sp.]|nr:DNA repair protein RadC [Salinimicrobium sp.]